MNEFILVQIKGANEFHLFAMDNTSEEIVYSLDSVCKEMVSVDISKVIFQCKTEQEARILAALQGKEVCGDCIKSLYTSKN